MKVQQSLPFSLLSPPFTLLQHTCSLKTAVFFSLADSSSATGIQQSRPGRFAISDKSIRKSK